MERLKSADGESVCMGEILLMVMGIILYAVSASAMTSLRIIQMNVTAVMFLTDAVIIITGAVILREVSVLLYSVALSVSASFFVDLGYTFGRKEVDVVA